MIIGTWFGRERICFHEITRPTDDFDNVKKSQSDINNRSHKNPQTAWAHCSKKLKSIGTSLNHFCQVLLSNELK